MNAKLLIALVIAINCYGSCGAALRRTPKVYNALITTDENLTSSRAYPVIQPTIHEPGVAHFPFGPYNPYGFYSPPLVRFGEAIAPGLHPREQLPYPLPYSQYPQSSVAPQQEDPQELPYPGFPLTQNPAEPEPVPVAPQDKPKDQPIPREQPVPTIPDQYQNVPNSMPQPQNQQPQAMPNEKLPIPLNEFGLPPALIPLPQYHHSNHHGNPVSLPTYGYHQYPVIYDPIIEYREQYLPPYDYFPSLNYVYGPAVSTNKLSTPQIPAPPAVPTSPSTASPPSTLSPRAEEEETSATADTSDTLTQGSVTDVPNIESIKNVSKNKNHAVPDVPPPPIPSGAKAKKQQH